MRLVNIKGRWAIGLALAAVSVTAAACGAAATSPQVSDSATSTESTQAAVAPAQEVPAATIQDTPAQQAPSAAVEKTPAQQASEKSVEDPKTSDSNSAQAKEISDFSPAPGIEPDPDYEQKLIAARFSTGGWTTDFSLHSVPFDSIVSGGPPRDGIPPLDSPTFVTIESANEWLDDKEPVISFQVNDVARAYPLQILTWHEIVNDMVEGVPVAVTFCPLCNSAIVFDRRLDGVVFDFGTSGRLRNSDLIMWDRQTESWWQQLTGEAIIGQATGRKLTFLPAPIVSWADYKIAHPQGDVLSKDTGFGRSYGRNPYAGYDEAAKPPFLFFGDLDGRLLPKERVVALSVGDVDAAFPFTTLEQEGVINYTVNNQDIAVVFRKGTTSALDASSISSSRDVGATGVFDPNLNGKKLTFTATETGFTDSETGSSWTLLGRAVEGELAGSNLTPIVHANHFWFAWAAFKPDTKIYQGPG